MDFRNVCVFKGREETGRHNESVSTAHETDAQDRARENRPAKKREHKTKLIVVPAGCFLRCAARRSRVDHPVALSLRLPDGGISWNMRDREALLSLSRCEEVEKTNLTYLRDIRGILYIEVCRDGRLTVDKNCLPGVRHLQVLSEQETEQLWDSRKSA